MQETNKGDVRNIRPRLTKNASKTVAKADVNLNWLSGIDYELYIWLHSYIHIQFTLFGINVLTGWARMSLKAYKWKILVFTKGKVDYDAKLFSSTSQFRELILTICSNPVKFLGCVISLDMTDKDPIEIITSSISTSLSSISKSKFRRVQKLWILQHLLVCDLWWLLLIYEIPISTVSCFEQKISSDLRKMAPCS